MSQFRQDAVTGDWVVIAPERAKRPHDFLPAKKERTPSAIDTCPFEDLEKSGNGPILSSRPLTKKDWRAVIVPNKFPALQHFDTCTVEMRKGPYLFTEGIGHHELLITRDHHAHFRDLSKSSLREMFSLLQERYMSLREDDCMIFISSFYNWGPSAGASLYHPHYQIFALPIVPPHVAHALKGSSLYYKKNKSCVQCDVLRHELAYKKRIILQNQHAIALAPFASRSPFEVTVYPRKHFSSFEETPSVVVDAVAFLLQDVLRRMNKYLNDPDLNFFIDTSPLEKKKKHDHYHWHVDVLPKFTTPAGFELSTNIDINVIDPDKVPLALRGKSFA